LKKKLESFPVLAGIPDSRPIRGESSRPTRNAMTLLASRGGAEASPFLKEEGREGRKKRRIAWQGRKDPVTVKTYSF